MDDLDRRVEDVLVQRLKEIVQFYTVALDQSPAAKAKLVRRHVRGGSRVTSHVQLEAGEQTDERTTVSMLDFVMEEPVKHEIHIRNQACWRASMLLQQLTPNSGLGRGPAHGARSSCADLGAARLALVCP